MGKSYNKGGLIGGFDQLRAPNAPTIGEATAGDQQLSVAFTEPVNFGDVNITNFTVTVDGAGGATGITSPITVTGLTNGTEYTFSVIANNAFGSSPSSATNTATPATPNFGARGIFVAGNNAVGVPLNVIDYITIDSTGNATDFGDLNVLSRGQNGGLAGGRRGVIGGIHQGDGIQFTDNISYITTSSTGNASDFGDLTQARAGLGAFSSGTRGCFGGGAD